MANVYPRWFPTENGPVAVDYNRSTLNLPYISLSIIVLSGVLSPFLLLIIVHPLIDFIVGVLLYALALGLAIRLAYRMFGRKPLTVLVEGNIIIVKYLFKKKAIRPDNIEYVDWEESNLKYVTAIVHISSSRKPIVLRLQDFNNSMYLLRTLVLICGLKGLAIPEFVKNVLHEDTPAIANHMEGIAGVRQALYRKLV